MSEAARLMLTTRHWIMSLALAQHISSKRLRRLAQKSGLGERIVLLKANRPLVFTHGLFRPKVWLSTGLLNILADDELESVLRHEAHHALAHDPLKILAARCLGRALFFIPVARDLCEAYLISKEIAADEHATRAMDDALPLARALRKLLHTQLFPVPEAALVGKLDVTEARLLALLDPRRSQPLFAPKRLGVSLLLLTIFLAIALAPAAGHLPSFTECAPTAILALGWS
jgi:beta-lactamase regulating signal transducer with metallopeptidase domain